jgi:hypothetical protein
MDNVRLGSLAVTPGENMAAIGDKVVCYESNAVAFGCGSTMAVRHADGAWTIDWPEAERISRIVPGDDSKEGGFICLRNIAAAVAVLLVAARGQISER